MSKYEAVIGLEIHAQIATGTKMFCPCSCDSFNKEPNVNVCPVCMGFPGQLPAVNEMAVKKGITAALALNCTIPDHSKFDRKNYFYPDLPKGFQISQFDEPLAINGHLDIEMGAERKRIGITRLHLEDDAGKLTHVNDGTLCDYNRSGIPLMEIVSEPDMRSADEAQAYAKMMQVILRYVGASEADMEKGMMRFDASVSLRPSGDGKLYPRAEIKNLNSFRSLVSAIQYEIERQTYLWEKSEPQSNDVTVGWSDDKKETYFLRDKEAAHDYRYFPEPDIPEINIERSFIEELKKELPELPDQKLKRYVTELKMSESEAKTIISDLNLAEFFEKVSNLSGDPKKATTFVSTILIAYLKKYACSVNDVKIAPESLAALIKAINDGRVSMNSAKTEIFEEMFETGKEADVIIREKGFTQVSDEKEVRNICEAVISENEKSIQDYRTGKQQAFFYLVGQVMKKTKGQANPGIVNQILNELIKS